MFGWNWIWLLNGLLWFDSRSCYSSRFFPFRSCQFRSFSRFSAVEWKSIAWIYICATSWHNRKKKRYGGGIKVQQRIEKGMETKLLRTSTIILKHLLMYLISNIWLCCLLFRNRLLFVDAIWIAHIVRLLLLWFVVTRFDTVVLFSFR